MSDMSDFEREEPFVNKQLRDIVNLQGLGMKTLENVNFANIVKYLYSGIDCVIFGFNDDEKHGNERTLLSLIFGHIFPFCKIILKPKNTEVSGLRSYLLYLVIIFDTRYSKILGERMKNWYIDEMIQLCPGSYQSFIQLYYTHAKENQENMTFNYYINYSISKYCRRNEPVLARNHGFYWIDEPVIQRKAWARGRNVVSFSSGSERYLDKRSLKRIVFEYMERRGVKCRNDKNQSIYDIYFYGNNYAKTGMENCWFLDGQFPDYSPMIYI